MKSVTYVLHTVLAFNANDHFVHGNHIVFMYVTALQSMYVTIIVQSHWLKPLYCVYEAISRAWYTILILKLF